jgi:hypothetical protein
MTKEQGQKSYQQIPSQQQLHETERIGTSSMTSSWLQLANKTCIITGTSN